MNRVAGLESSQSTQSLPSLMKDALNIETHFCVDSSDERHWCHGVHPGSPQPTEAWSRGRALWGVLSWGLFWGRDLWTLLRTGRYGVTNKSPVVDKIDRFIDHRCVCDSNSVVFAKYIRWWIDIRDASVLCWDGTVVRLFSYALPH